MMEAVKLLLNGDTRSFDLTWVIAFMCTYNSSRAKSVEQVLEMVASLAPKISTLKHLLVNALDHSRCEERFGIAFSPSMMNSISRMDQLQTLQLQYYKIEYQDLLKLGSCLPNLQHLHIKIYFDKHFEVDMEAVRRSFPKLKHFYFNVSVKNDQPLDQLLSYMDGYSRIFARLCVRHLLSLETVGSLISSPKRILLEAEQVVRLKSPRKLRHLLVEHSSHAEKAYWSKLFPDATHLELINEFDVFPAVPLEQEAARCALYLQFTKLVSLRLEAPSREMFQFFSQRYGANLHTLALDGYNEVSCSFKAIFTAFPNLTDLSLSMVDIVQDVEPFDPQILFAPLKKLHLSVPSDPRPIVVSNILSAPHLENVKLMYLHFDAGDIQHLTQLVASHQIFNELQTFLLHLKIQQNTSDLNGYSQLVKNICAHSAKLVDLAFCVKYNGIFDLTKSQAQILRDLGEPNMMLFLAAFKAYY